MRALEDNQAGLVDEYMELKAQEKEIKARMDEIKPILLEALQSEPDEQYERNGYAFTITYRKRWRYSEDLTIMEKEAKALRKVEEANGLAELQGHTASLVLKKA